MSDPSHQSSSEMDVTTDWPNEPWPEPDTREDAYKHYAYLDPSLLPAHAPAALYNEEDMEEGQDLVGAPPTLPKFESEQSTSALNSLRDLKLRDPREIGRVQKGGKKLQHDLTTRKFRNMMPFSRHTESQPPDVSKTHIVAVGAFDPSKLRTQQVDGPDTFLLADFLLLFQIFNGVIPNQTWLMPETDLKAQLNEHEDHQILQGSPWTNRKVALNEELHDTTVPAITQVPLPDLRSRFAQELTRAVNASAAANPQERVLVIMIGHGSDGTFHFDDESSVSINAFMRLALTKVEGTMPKVMLINTACQGGSWVRHTKFTSSGLSAVGKGQGQNTASWRMSNSTGRIAGSMFVTALAQQLTGKQPRDTNAETPEQSASYMELQRTLLSTLHRNDMFQYKWFTSFRAQDDKWGESIEEMTGIPMQLLRGRLDLLPTFRRDPTLHVGDFCNRDPNVPAHLRREFFSLYAKFKKNPTASHNARTQGHYMFPKASMPSDRQSEDMFLHLRREIDEVSKEYFASNPGDHVDDRNNAQIFAFQGRYKRYPNDIGAITAYLNELQYRMSIMRTAQRYVDELKIPLPKDCRIFDVDFPRWEGKYGTDKLFKKGGAGTWWYDNLRGSGRLDKLFPGWERNAFFIPYDKGWRYLIVALAWAPYSRKDLNQRLNKLILDVEKEVETVANEIKEDSQVRSKRQKLAAKLNIRYRDWSPERQATPNRGHRTSESLSTSSQRGPGHRRGGPASLGSIDVFPSIEPMDFSRGSSDRSSREETLSPQRLFSPHYASSTSPPHGPGVYGSMDAAQSSGPVNPGSESSQSPSQGSKGPSRGGQAGSRGSGGGRGPRGGQRGTRGGRG